MWFFCNMCSHASARDKGHSLLLRSCRLCHSLCILFPSGHGAGCVIPAVEIKEGKINSPLFNPDYLFVESVGSCLGNIQQSAEFMWFFCNMCSHASARDKGHSLLLRSCRLCHSLCTLFPSGHGAGCVIPRAGVKYVLSNTNTKIWIFQIQIQIFCSTLIQIQIQIQIHWFKYKYKYVQPNISSETVQIPNRAILWIPRYMLMACVSLCLGDTWR